jgi:hypothetical protein
MSAPGNSGGGLGWVLLLFILYPGFEEIDEGMVRHVTPEGCDWRANEGCAVCPKGSGNQASENAFTKIGLKHKD